MWVETEAALLALYGTPSRAAVAKVSPVITPHYRAWIEASPFMAIASVGSEGLDCSPRGEADGVVRVVGDRTVALPDRNGNQRIDTLRNIVRDPRVALMFLIPGADTVMRLNGRGRITADADVCARFAAHGRAPRTVLFVEADAVYFQCARAVMRSRLWDGGHADPAALPSVGTMLEALDAGIAARQYDAEWPERARGSMW